MNGLGNAGYKSFEDFLSALASRKRKTIRRERVAALSPGIAVHWLVSSRKVFTDSVARQGPARTRQKALFVGSALVGLAVTTGVVAGASALGLDPRLAKLVAVAASFAVTWLLRDSVVFRKVPAAQ